MSCFPVTIAGRSYGQGFNYVNSIRSQTLYGIGDPMSFGTPFERVLGVLGNKTSNINLIYQWNDMWQTVNVLGIRFRAVNNILDISYGKSIVAKEREWMNFMGISQSSALKMRKLIDRFGEVQPDGAVIPNIDRWRKIDGVTAEESKRLAANFKSAMIKEVDRTTITKGVTDIPRFGNSELGRLVFQWQNFNFAFNNKVLISGLQDADGRVMAGFGSLIIGGMLTEYLKSLETGQELPDNPAL